MGRTSFLVAIAAALLMMQFFPNQAGIIKWVIIALGGGYLLVRALLTYPKLYRDSRRLRAQRKEDAQSFRAYSEELAVIRARYDTLERPSGDAVNDAAYEAELAALHVKYRAMLERKFGTH